MVGEPFEGPVGLADRLDDLVLRLENWSARVRPLVVVAIVVVVLMAVGWWSWQAASATGPVEDGIPLANPVEGSADPGVPSSPAGELAGSATVAGSAANPASAVAPGSAEPEAVPVELVVHVVGAVRRPGLVTLDEGARVSDAVEAAGGVLPDGEVDRLNLASPVIDGMQIRVPSAPSPAGDEADGDQEPLIRLPSVASDGGPVGAGAGVGGGAPVDLNRASAAELESLPGIGPALAAAIIQWRTDHGDFATVEDLQAVPGIGPAKLGGLRDLVTL